MWRKLCLFKFLRCWYQGDTWIKMVHLASFPWRCKEDGGHFLFLPIRLHPPAQNSSLVTCVGSLWVLQELVQRWGYLSCTVPRCFCSCAHYVTSLAVTVKLLLSSPSISSRTAPTGAYHTSDLGAQHWWVGSQLGSFRCGNTEPAACMGNTLFKYFPWMKPCLQTDKKY